MRMGTGGVGRKRLKTECIMVIGMKMGVWRLAELNGG